MRSNNPFFLVLSTIFVLIYPISCHISSTSFPIDLTWKGGKEPKPWVLVDHKEDVAGLVSFQVELGGFTNFSVAYSESILYAESGDWSGGPSVLCRTDSWDRLIFNAANTTGKAVITEDQIQGGFRYQNITLQTAGHLRINGIKVKPDHYTLPPKGAFSSSSPTYNKMWKIGVDTVKLNMIPANAISDQFTPTLDGFHIIPNRLGVFTRGCDWFDYSFSFQVKIVKGGFSFGVGSDGNGDQLSMEVSIGADQDSVVFENALNFGTLQTTALPNRLVLNQFFDVSAKINGDILQVFIDKNPAILFDLKLKYQKFKGAPAIFSMKWQEFYAKNALVTTTVNNTVLYKNQLNTRQSLKDWSAHANEFPMVVDGSKRDRMIWVSDLLVAGPTMYYSFYTPEYIEKTIRLLTSYAKTNGLVGTSLTPLWNLQSSPSDGFPRVSFYSYSYALSLLEVARDYLMFTGDLNLIKSEWKAWKKMLDYFASSVDSKGFIVTDKLRLTSDWSWWLEFGNTNYTKLQIQWSVALDCAATFTGLMGDKASSLRYRAESLRLKRVINSDLFNNTMGLYRVSDLWPHLTAQDVNSFAILHNQLPKEQSYRMLDILEKALKRNRGYMAFANDTQMDPYSNVFSPYVSFFHASAAFETNRTDMAFRILESTWLQMADDKHRDYTGTCWEQHPIIGQWQNFISHAHAWSSGSTALITKYVLGVWPTSPGFATYSVKPNLGNLTWAEGTIPSPKGNIVVHWKLENSPKQFSIRVEAPKGTRGTVVIPFAGYCAVLNEKRAIYPASSSEHAVVVLKSGGSFNIVSKPICATI
eukprot:TRINITY_DN1054_c0_g1_i1.p1 TRINITY_DN1054_c0_g1~~TRINITY_DN1054_c0_g1_i1.p1  ORF type:complete len:829 (-),score=197.60 TRINITY_DN1054_c0_g1_i1:55-2490(-)